MNLAIETNKRSRRCGSWNWIYLRIGIDSVYRLQLIQWDSGSYLASHHTIHTRSMWILFKMSCREWLSAINLFTKMRGIRGNWWWGSSSSRRMKGIVFAGFLLFISVNYLIGLKRTFSHLSGRVNSNSFVVWRTKAHVEDGVPPPSLHFADYY